METDLNTIIKTRRTIHRYLSNEVDQNIVNRALESAHFAPNHRKTWPWVFRVIGAQSKERLIESEFKRKTANGELSEVERLAFQEKRLNPSLIVVTQKRCEDPRQAKEDYAAVACAIQNLSLSLHAEGVGSKWSTGSLTRTPHSYESLNIDSTKEEIVGFIWYGYAAKVPVVVRPALEEVVLRLS